MSSGKSETNPVPEMSDETALMEAVSVIQELLRSKDALSASQLARAVAREQRASVLSPREKIRILIKAATVDLETRQFEVAIYEALDKIVNESTFMRGFMEEYVVVCLEEAVAGTGKGGGVQFVSHLKACYEEDILTQETIVAWWTGSTTRCEPLVDASVRRRLRRLSKPLVEWLAREDEEGSGSSDGEN